MVKPKGWKGNYSNGFVMDKRWDNFITRV